MAGFDNDVLFGSGLDVGTHPSTGTPDASVEKSTSGGEVKLQIVNSSDTASSNATHEIQVAGTSAGDPWTQWTVGTTQSYAMGIDNSDSDNFKFTTDADATVDPSSGTEIYRYDLSLSPNSSIFGGGTPIETPQTVGIIKSNIAGAVSLDVQNTDTTDIGSNAAVAIRVNGAGAGDPVVTWDINSVASSNYTAGIDNSDSDRFKIVSATADLSAAATVLLSATLDGEVNFPATPAFLAFNNAVQADVTGDGTVATVPFGTEVYDQNNDFATPTFTAPVTGRHHFDALVQLVDVAAGFTDTHLILTTSNRIYWLDLISGGVSASGGAIILGGSTYADMDATDTATLTVVAGGSTKTVDIFGAATTDPRTYFSGKLDA